MAKGTKIVSFEKKRKKQGKPNFELRAEISVSMIRKGERYKIDWSSPDPSLTVEEIYQILKSIFDDLKVKVKTIEIKKMDNYDITFTLLYYENSNKKSEIRYIWIPQNISDKKMVEYLFTMLGVYDYKKNQGS